MGSISSIIFRMCDKIMSSLVILYGANCGLMTVDLPNIYFPLCAMHSVCNLVGKSDSLLKCQFHNIYSKIVDNSLGSNTSVDPLSTITH